MSLMIEQMDTDCSLSLSEILMRVATIKSQWSDGERQLRSEIGDRRRQQLAELLVDSEPHDLELDSQFLGAEEWFQIEGACDWQQD